jgi:hypothetical protein
MEWDYESQPAALLADAQRNVVRVILPNDAFERRQLTHLIGRQTRVGDDGSFAVPLPKSPLPGLLLFESKVGDKAIYDSMSVPWTGAAIDDVEWRVRF